MNTVKAKHKITSRMVISVFLFRSPSQAAIIICFSDIVTSVAFCNNSERVISCGNDCAVKVFDIKTQTVVKTFSNCHRGEN